MRILLVSVAFLMSSAVHADSFQENEQAVSQAQNTYFNALMQNPSLSNKEKGQLYYQTVQPTENALTQSISREWSETIQSRLATAAAQDPGKSPASKMLSKVMSKKAGQLTDENAGDDNGSLNSSASTGNTTPTAQRNETALSGSGIKPILVFPGKKPRPSPSPSLNLQ